MHVKEIWIGDVDSETQVESWRTMEAAAAKNRVQDGEKQWSIFHRLAATRLKSSIQGYYSVTVVKKVGSVKAPTERASTEWGNGGRQHLPTPLPLKIAKLGMTVIDDQWWLDNGLLSFALIRVW